MSYATEIAKSNQSVGYFAKISPRLTYGPDVTWTEEASILTASVWTVSLSVGPANYQPKIVSRIVAKIGGTVYLGVERSSTAEFDGSADLEWYYDVDNNDIYITTDGTAPETYYDAVITFDSVAVVSPR